MKTVRSWHRTPVSAPGNQCIVVAPSLIPKRPGDRVKTDRWKRGQSGEAALGRRADGMWVPDPGHEAMRDLVRARLDALLALGRAPAALGLPVAAGLPLWAAEQAVVSSLA
jgi:hypothetical protein